MQKHQPFGWIQDKRNSDLYQITSMFSMYRFKDIFVTCTFVDGTPFGVKE